MSLAVLMTPAPTQFVENKINVDITNTAHNASVDAAGGGFVPGNGSDIASLSADITNNHTIVSRDNNLSAENISLSGGGFFITDGSVGIVSGKIDGNSLNASNNGGAVSQRRLAGVPTLIMQD